MKFWLKHWPFWIIFLFNNWLIFKSKEHYYYKWKLFSILQGDDIQNWREIPFFIIEEGPLIIPPKNCMLNVWYNNYLQIDDKLTEQVNKLSPDMRKYFEHKLSELKNDNKCIKELMEFSLDNSCCSEEVLLF